MSGQTWSRERIHKWLKGLIPLALVVVLLVFWGRAVMTVAAPFVVGFLIAYIFNPVVAWIEGRSRRKHRMNRLMAVLALYLALVLAGVLLTLVLAMAVQEVVLFGQRLPHYGANLYRLIEEYILTQWEKVPEEFVQWVKSQLEAENLQRILQEEILPRLQNENIKSGVGTAVKGVTGFVQVAFGLVVWAAQQLMGGAGNFFAFISSATLAVIIAFYLLLDYERFLNKVSGLIPETYRENTVRIARRIDLQISGFLRGQLTICVCIGILVATGLSLAGVDYALLIGLAAGAFNIIPYLGPVMGAVPAVILTGLEVYQGPDTDWGHLVFRLGLVGLVFGAVQTLDGFLISPKIMGDRLDLHPMIILFALLLGGALMGLMGMLLAVPIACIIRVLIEEIYFPDPNRPL